jgi:beta-lactamase regulating signal transducer with metallopeptidase domain
MLAAFIEAVLRSLILALLVWAALRIFRVQNVVSQRSAWIAVLVGSLLMPLALPFTARWRVLPLATIPTPASLDLQSAVAPTTLKAASGADSFTGSMIVASRHDQGGTLRTTMATAGRNRGHALSSDLVQLPDPSAASVQPFAIRGKLSLFGVALLAYFLIAVTLLARLLFGFACALRLWYSSTPVTSCGAMHISGDFKLRFSHRISSPVTIGSGVVLPSGYTSWPEEKLRVVLAHERSHVTLHDFHLQILASIYAALTWFSPLGWWLKRNLSDLGEAISDRSGLNAASNRSAYAQILLEFAAAPRPTLIGVAMARPSSISRRIEHLFSDSYLRQAFSGSASARVAVLVLPVILFAAGAMVRVQAATQSSAVATVSSTPAAASQSARTVPVFAAQPGTSTTLRTRSIPATVATSAAPSAPALPELALTNPPAPPMALREGAAQSEATFDRNLSFNGTLDLSVSTASGDITFTRGTANHIRIHGIVKANKNGDPAQVQQIAANPPIEQNGNTIRIGAHQQNLRNISISYQIEAPADTILNAASASGDIADTGVGNGAKMMTASGNITASGLQGGFKVQTASGDIAIDSAGRGDAWAQTGSGDIDLKGVSGALTAQTGSGTIKAVGTPSSPWKLQAGSGDIQLTTGSAPMDLDASTGSGDISAPSSVAMQYSKDHHHVQAQLNGGGPEVRAATGSGDIRID